MEARLTQIPKDEVLRYLGYRGQDMEDSLQRQIDSCIQAVMDCAKPRLTYRIVPVVDCLPQGLSLGGSDIRKLLSESTQAIVMAATLGPEAENLLRRTEVTNMANAVIMDSAQSTAIENVCDNFESEMRLSYRAEDKYLTDRYSPGYGDLPLLCQSDLAEFLVAEKRIGLTITKSSIMVPRKSVTCIIGIAGRPQRLLRRGCGSCLMSKTCIYRKGGRICNA